MIETIITALVSGLASSGLLTWYFQERIKRKYEIENKKLEAELAQQSFRYSKVFESTEKIIVAVYQKLSNVKGTFLVTSLNSEDTFKEHLKMFQKEVIEFDVYFEDHKLYIPKQTATRIEEFLSILREGEFDLIVTDSLKWNKERDKIHKTLDTMLELLCDDFQRILGFPIQETKK